MLGIKMWKSIRWKLIFIYFLLVFIAMIIVGIFILKELEVHHLNKISSDLSKLGNGSLMATIEKYDNLTDSQLEIQRDIESITKGILEEVLIIDEDLTIIAHSNGNLVNRNALDVLDTDLLRDGLIGKSTEKDDYTSQKIPSKNMAFPVLSKNGDTVKGIIYIKADLTSIYQTIDQSKLIFLKATVIALFVTVILGFLIARSITVPINDVTEKAEKMAKGDFSQKVSIKSDDEIGRLAEMFNFLRDKLDFTLSEISNEKSKLETILKYMADGLIAVNTEGYIIHANPTAKEMLNLDEIEIYNKPYDEMISRYSKSLTLASIQKKSKKWEGKENFEYKDSVFLARYAPFKDENHNNIGIVMILQDITERQRLENMQREFVANVSHELKTPLTSIKSYTETLLDGAINDTEVAKQFLSVVDSESDRMSRLVKDLLQLSRLDYKREKWNKEQGDLVEILKAAILKIEINAKNKNQHLNCLYKNGPINVFVDKDRIEQVILNIISNAIKYTQENGRIDIDTFKTNNEAHIMIKDNGIGIPEEDLPRLFERFYRVDKARSRALGGTGLGLSIAKQIMKAHGGDIIIQSKDGEGTKVTIVIPMMV